MKLFTTIALCAVVAMTAGATTRLPKHAVSRAESSLLITDEDEMVKKGVKKLYSRSADAYFPMELPSNPVPAAPAITDMTSDVVLVGDTLVYIKDPISCKRTNTYIWGSRKGNTITVSLPQLVSIEAGEDYENDFYIYKYKLVKDPQGDYYDFETDPEKVTSIVYNIDDKGIITMEANSAIGLIRDPVIGDDSDFLHAAGYVDAEQVFTPVLDPLTPPAGLKTEQWAMIHGTGSGHYIQLGFEGNDVYIKGIAGYNAPNAWVKGTLAEGKITIPSGQPLGKSAAADHFAYFQATEAPMVDNGIFVFYDYKKASVLDAAVFNYDAQAKKMSIVEPADSTKGNGIVISYSANGLDYDNFFTDWRKFENPRAEFRGPVEGHIIPANPANVRLDDTYFAQNGCYTLWFNVPRRTASGDFMDIAHAYYNVVVDDELFTVYPDEYKKVTNEMTNIRYWYADPANFDISTSGNDGVMFTIYARGFKDAGVQCFYVNEDGEYSYSDLVYAKGGVKPHIDAPAISVKDILMGEVVSEQYYDLSGRMVQNPQNGIFIRVARDANGVMSTSKVIRK